MKSESIFVHDLKELNSALSNRKVKTILFKPAKVRSFDLQALKKCAESRKKFAVLFSEFLSAGAMERKKLFQKHFALFRIAKKAGLKIEVLNEREQKMDFFAEFLGGKK